MNSSNVVDFHVGSSVDGGNYDSVTALVVLDSDEGDGDTLYGSDSTDDGQENETTGMALDVPGSDEDDDGMLNGSTSADDDQESGAVGTALDLLGSDGGSFDRERREREIKERFFNIGEWSPSEFDKVDKPCQYLPKLPDKLYDSLVEDIKVNGVLNPVVTDEQGRILDGHNRAYICWRNHLPCPVGVRFGLSEAEKKAEALKGNTLRRQLTNPQKFAVFQNWYLSLPEDERPVQDEIKIMFGVAQATVCGWIKKLGNITCDNPTPPADSGSSVDDLRKTMGIMQSLVASLASIERPEKCFDNATLQLWKKFFIKLIPKLHDAIEPYFTYQASAEGQQWFDVDI